MSPDIWCPFCSKRKKHKVIARARGIVGIKNAAPRLPVSGVFFTEDPFTKPDGRHFTSILNVSIEAWQSLMQIPADYILQHEMLFHSARGLTVRLVFNYNSPIPRDPSPGARQTVEHLHLLLYGPGLEGGTLGSFCTADGYPPISQIPFTAVTGLQTDKWRAIKAPYNTGPVEDVLFLPPKGHQGLVEADPQGELLKAILSYLSEDPEPFADSFRLVCSSGDGITDLPVDVHLLGGRKVDLKQYSEHPYLPESHLMEEMDKDNRAIAAEEEQEYCPSWWKRIVSLAPVR